MIYIVHSALIKRQYEQQRNYYKKRRDYNRFYRTEKERDIININNNFV